MCFLISGFRGLTLGSDFLANGTGELPGLRLNVSGNLVEKGSRSLFYELTTLNDLMFYNLTYFIPPDLGEVPEIVISFEKTPVV